MVYLYNLRIKDVNKIMSKIRLSDTTFIIPFFYDHKERLENLNCILKFLTDNFETNIIISESGEVSRKREFYSGFEYLHIFEDRNDGVFHRTKVINNGIKEAETPYIAVYDSDVIFEPKNILKAVECLMDGATLAYPYSGNFIDVNRSYIQDGIIVERESFTMDSYGGAFFVNREDYWKCGLDYEEFVAWCPDDIERVT